MVASDLWDTRPVAPEIDRQWPAALVTPCQHGHVVLVANEGNSVAETMKWARDGHSFNCAVCGPGRIRLRFPQLGDT